MSYKPMPSDRGGKPVPVSPGDPVEKFAQRSHEVHLASLAKKGYPNLGERIIRSTLHVVATLVLLLIGIMLVLGLSVVARIGQGLDNLAPGPSSTGCPFGEGQCGG